MLKFHLDENMPTIIATGLQKRGADITTSNESGLIGASDEEQLAFALKEKRIIITRDTDFLRLHQSGAPHLGIVYWTQKKNSIGHLIRFLDLLPLSKTMEEMAGNTIFI